MQGMYRQCELSKPLDGGVARMIGWIPEKVAIVGAVVRLKDGDGGEWTDGWTVQSVPRLSLPFDLLSKRSRDYRKTRDASDI